MAAGLEFDRDKIKRLSKNIISEVQIPETDKNFIFPLNLFI